MNLISSATELPPEPVSDPVLRASLSDADLLDAWSRDQHAAALEALVQRYSVMVLSVCRRRCRSEADAEDAFQSTFLYLARNSKKIRHPERLVGWLHRVAQRAAVATMKSTQRETEPMVDPPADPDDPFDRLTQRHEAIVLDEELADLPEHYRSAIVMHLYEGHPIQNMAEHFGTTVGSIRGRLQRGKQLLAQRLRRRGIVPVLAYASAGTWTASASQASMATETFARATVDGELPDPPIDTPLLESLLAQGVRLMPSLYTTAGLLGGSALVAMMMVTSGGHGQTTAQKTELSFPSPVIAQLGGSAKSTNVRVHADGFASETKTNRRGKKNNSDDSIEKGGAADGTLNDTQKLVWAEKAVIPKPTSAVALAVMDVLEGETDLEIRTTLIELPDELQKTLEVPVLLDARGVAFAKQQSGEVVIQFSETAVPVRTALRRMLEPLGLKAVVEDEGLVITADPAALVHQGIGTTRWTNIDDDVEKKIAETLDVESKAQFVEVPLQEALATLSEQLGLQILVDRRAFEEVGLSGEEPVTLSMSGVKTRSLLRHMLNNLDLDYTIQGESLVVTTIEAAEAKLLNRIYWLEGTGYAAGDDESIVNSIQSSITPDTWEILGGPSTIVPLGSSRPALLVSTTYDVHENIDKLLRTLRETHFGKDPVLESVQIHEPRESPTTDGIGGGGFM